MHALTSCLLHCVFRTKNRAPLLTAEIRRRLWPYLGGTDAGGKKLAERKRTTKAKGTSGEAHPELGT